MELTWTALQLILLVAGTTLAQDFNGFQSGFQPSFQSQRFGQDNNFQQPQQRERPTRLLSQVPSAVRKQRPIQQVQPTFQQPQPTFRQPQPAFQQQVFQPARASPPPPPQPQPQPQAQPQQFFDQPEESFQQTLPQQQSFQQPQEPTFRQPTVSPSPLRKVRPTEASRLTRPDEEAEIVRQQNLNAKYSFAAGVTDGISDNQHLREETRDGLALKGMYSYSDGYFRRTIHYEADENGYRVTNEEVEPIGNGPQEDPNGRADVELHVTPGQPLTYSVTSADISPKTLVQQQPQSQLAQFNIRRPQAQHQRERQQQQLPQEQLPQFEQQQF